jgi:hypothetical protein
MEQFEGVNYPDFSKVRNFIEEDITTIANLGAETTVFASKDTGYYYDLCMVTGANSSDKTISYNLRDKTGGDTKLVLQFPASVTTTFTFYRPLRQTSKNNNWTLEAGTLNANSNTSLTFYLQLVRSL